MEGPRADKRWLVLLILPPAALAALGLIFWGQLRGLTGARVLEAYGVGKMEFGRDYLIPKPLDPRLLTRVSAAVARAAVESGVARRPITDWEAYAAELQRKYAKK